MSVETQQCRKEMQAHYTNHKKERVKSLLLELSEAERLDVLRGFCFDCGSKINNWICDCLNKTIK